MTNLYISYASDTKPQSRDSVLSAGLNAPIPDVGDAGLQHTPDYPINTTPVNPTLDAGRDPTDDVSVYLDPDTSDTGVDLSHGMANGAGDPSPDTTMDLTVV